MNEFVSSLTDKMHQTLQRIENEEQCILRCAERSIEELEKAFIYLKNFTVSYNFESKEEEIKFFKKYKPKLFSALIFYRKLYNIEVNRPKGGEEKQRDYVKRQLCRLNDHFDDNRDFYKYYRLKETHMDEHYFLRQKPTIQMTMESFYFERDPMFSTAADFKMAKIIANDRIEKYLMEELEKLEHRDGYYSLSIKEKLTWTAGKVFLIELIYALYLFGAFNNKKATLKQIVAYFENMFNVDLGANPSKAYFEMRNRKQRTTFLDRLRKILNNKMDEDDYK